MENFLRGHVEAFGAWPGVPRVVLYDNLKSVVMERHGDAIRFHPTLFEFAGHYRYEPRPVAPARGNEKGRVERAIRYAATFQPKGSLKEAVPYSSEAMRRDLERIRGVWADCQATRNRNAIYAYLSAVYGLVAWWAADGREIEMPTAAESV